MSRSDTSNDLRDVQEMTDRVLKLELMISSINRLT